MSDAHEKRTIGAIVGKDFESLVRSLRQASASHIRWMAAWALGATKDVRAVEPLIEALSDEAGSVRGYAALALGEIGDKKALKPLIHTLKDGDGVVRGYAAGALGKLNDAGALDHLIEALRDEYWLVRGNAATSLGEISDERAVEHLKVMSKVNGDWHVKEAAQEAMRKIERARREREEEMPPR